jgi:hypothetical protein
MIPNYVCPCCGYRLHYSGEIARKIIGEIAGEFDCDPHQVEWASYFKSRDVLIARAVSVYFIRVFTGEKFKTINEVFHWKQYANNAGNRYAYVVGLMEESGEFRSRMEDIEHHLRFSLSKEFSIKVA